MSLREELASTAKRVQEAKFSGIKSKLENAAKSGEFSLFVDSERDKLMEIWLESQELEFNFYGKIEGEPDGDPGRGGQAGGREEKPAGYVVSWSTM